MKSLALCLIALALSALSLAQAKPEESSYHPPLDHPGCKVYFGVAWIDPTLPNGYALMMSDVQMNWYSSKGINRYKSVCYWPRKAQYVIAWASNEQTRLTTIPVQNTSVTESRTQTGESGSASVYGSEGQTANVYGQSSSESRTRSTTTSSTTAVVPQQVRYARAAIIPIASWQSGKPDLLYMTEPAVAKGMPEGASGSYAIGYGIGHILHHPHPDQQVLERAIKFLAERGE